MSPHPTTDELVEFLVAVWRDALGGNPDHSSDFFGLGGDSIAAISIATAVADRYRDFDGIELRALEALFESRRLRAVAQALADFTRGAQAQ